MIIDLLIKKQQLQLQQCTAEYQQHKAVRQAYLWLLGQRSKQFIGSVPGLALSFSVGMLMPLRHNATFKMVWRLGGLRWLRSWL
ncbi:hypothetical protein [Arsukibacterium sp.]|uniref:hypothetical protein n=1 Tax=Arsukibacterium sp. TaxID=1977258 RepID=UPI002FDA3ACD